LPKHNDVTWLDAHGGFSLSLPSIGNSITLFAAFDERQTWLLVKDRNELALAWNF
jgi:hypothetical protein